MRPAKCGDLKALAAAGEKFAVIYADPPWEYAGSGGLTEPSGALRGAHSGPNAPLWCWGTERNKGPHRAPEGRNFGDQ
jgi:hypothetical protein